MFLQLRNLPQNKNKKKLKTTAKLNLNYQKL